MQSAKSTSLLKRELRKRVRNALASMSRADIQEQSAEVTRRLLKTPEFGEARSVALYAAMENEFDTSELLRTAFVENKRVFLPRVVSKKDHTMVMLEARSMSEIESWEPNSWGIREPPLEIGRAETPRDVSLDLIVVPGVAFDSSGARCGHGMGFYDTFFKTYQSTGKPMPALIALALRPQLVSEVPMTDTDWAVDKVIVPG